jgi:general stress protein 26
VKTYQTYYDEVMAHIEKKGTGVLATSYQDVPMTRMVSFVVYDGKLAFQTSHKLEKYTQIAQNPRVSLNFTNINIQGKATIQEGQAIQHEQFMTLFQKQHQGSYEAYSKMLSNRVIEIVPEKIVLWVYEAGQPLRVFLDVIHQDLKLEPYLHSNQD